MSTTTTTEPTVARTILDQIGRMTVLAISGGRAITHNDGVILPVDHGYTVEVDLDRGSDTYTVRRVRTRAGHRTVIAERDRVYYDEVSEIAYRASCYLDAFPGAVA